MRAETISELTGTSFIPHSCCRVHGMPQGYIGRSWSRVGREGEGDPGALPFSGFERVVCLSFVGSSLLAYFKHESRNYGCGKGEESLMWSVILIT